MAQVPKESTAIPPHKKTRIPLFMIGPRPWSFEWGRLLVRVLWLCTSATLSRIRSLSRLIILATSRKPLQRPVSPQVPVSSHLRYVLFVTEIEDKKGAGSAPFCSLCQKRSAVPEFLVAFRLLPYSFCDRQKQQSLFFVGRLCSEDFYRHPSDVTPGSGCRSFCRMLS